MLDEASGNPRVNLQGNTAYNLTENGAVNNDTTNKMEGAASALYASIGGQQLTHAPGPTDALRNLAQPFSCGFWARQTGGSAIKEVMFNAGINAGWALEYDATNTVWRFAANVPGSDIITNGSTTALNAWAHVAVTRVNGAPAASTLYVNGVSVGSHSTNFVTNVGPEFSLGANQGGSAMTGEIDEAWCFQTAISAASVCRICSCGIRGEQCTCGGATYVSSGRNASACGSCVLPACNAATPP